MGSVAVEKAENEERASLLIWAHFSSYHPQCVRPFTGHIAQIATRSIHLKTPKISTLDLVSLPDDVINKAEFNV